MKEDANVILEKIVDRKAAELSLEKYKRNHTGSVVSIWRQEDWHLFTWLKHPLVPTLEIQCSIGIEGDFVRGVWFPHPTLITSDTKKEYILFSNEANLELHSGGRFWCNEDFDIAYEIVLKKEMIDSCPEEAAKLLFDIPYAQFQDIHVPLIMLSDGTWKSDIAIRYISELRNNGYVDNSDYNLL